MNKLKVLFHSAYPGGKTGFGKHVRLLLSHLYQTGKYELYMYASGVTWEHPDFERWPWETRGALPALEEWEFLRKDAGRAALINYGAHYIDRVIKEVQPDVYIGIEDIWAFGCLFPYDETSKKYTTKPWWNKIACAIHTTLDSLPIYPMAIELTEHIKNYWVWSEFAEKEFRNMGHNHIKTIHGCVNTSNFHPLDAAQKKILRRKQSIPEDAFVIGFVFRNQLRKSVPNLLEGYARFRKDNPKIKNARLLLHTHFSEEKSQSWDIVNLAKNHGVDAKELCCTYICRACGKYYVKPFTDECIDCPSCHACIPNIHNAPKPNSLITVNVQDGVTDSQLNEIYNLMDVYCHPFTSGGQEVPIQEAKSAGLVTLVTNYVCGEDMNTQEAGSIPLDYGVYYETGSLFKKATTYPHSIAAGLRKVANMDAKTREALGLQGRQWVLNNYSVASISAKVQEFLDSCEKTKYAFDLKEELKDPDAIIEPCEDNKLWVKSLYKNILKDTVADDHKGLQDWLLGLSNGQSRTSIEKYFRDIATRENNRINNVTFECLFDNNGKKRVLYVIPKSIGDIFIASSTFKSVKERYPEHDLYVATLPQYFEVLDGDMHVHKVIPYHEAMENELAMIGYGETKGFVDVYMNPVIQCQRQLNYLSNDKLGVELT